MLSRPIIRMPNFASGTWLNSPPLTGESLRGRVVLVDFWEYSCKNCLQTIPYVVGWDRLYRPLGLTVIGIHTPEFRFGRVKNQVSSALERLEITYPVLLDNDQENWDLFANKAWPTKYLIDQHGYMRYQRVGEGGYRDTERAIQQLLLEIDRNMTLPPLGRLLRPEDEVGAVCFRVTPELHAGFDGGLFGGALGNPEGYIPRESVAYQLPVNRNPGIIYVSGFWKAHKESMSFVGQESGSMVVGFEAAGVNVVMSPSADEVDLHLNIWPEHDEPLVEVLFEGRPLPAQWAGADVVYDESGRSLVFVRQPRMYRLLEIDRLLSGEITLIPLTRGVSVYTFTFATCVKPHARGRGDMV